MSVTRYDSARGFTRKLWEPVPWEYLDDPGLGFKYYDDFTPGVAGDYTVATIAGSPTLLNSATHGGALVLSAGAATDTHGGNVSPGGATNSFITPSATTKIYFEMRFTPTLQTGGSNTGNFFLGLSTMPTTTAPLTTTGALNAADYIGFHLVNGTSCLAKLAYLNAGATLYLGSSLLTQTTTATQLGFVMDGLTSITPYVNKVKGDTVAFTSTKSAPDSVMNVSWALTAEGGTGTPTMSVDWVRVAVVGGN